MHNYNIYCIPRIDDITHDGKCYAIYDGSELSLYHCFEAICRQGDIERHSHQAIKEGLITFYSECSGMHKQSLESKLMFKFERRLKEILGNEEDRGTLDDVAIIATILKLKVSLMHVNNEEGCIMHTVTGMRKNGWNLSRTKQCIRVLIAFTNNRFGVAVPLT